MRRGTVIEGVLNALGLIALTVAARWEGTPTDYAPICFPPSGRCQPHRHAARRDVGDNVGRRIRLGVDKKE